MKGIGGGSSEGPGREHAVPAEHRHRAVDVALVETLAEKGLPPLRPTDRVNSNRHRPGGREQRIETPCARVAYGRSTINASQTSGNERNDESRNALRKGPAHPAIPRIPGSRPADDALCRV